MFALLCFGIAFILGAGVFQIKLACNKELDKKRDYFVFSVVL